MATILTIQILIFTLYIGMLIFKFGVLPSISESWYALKPYKLSFLFTLFCWLIGFSLFFYITDKSPFFFFSGAGICFTGAATAFKIKESMTRKVHYIGAVVCIMSALIGLVIEHYIYHPIIIFFLIYGLLKMFKVKNFTWWIEIVAFICILLGFSEVFLL